MKLTINMNVKWILISSAMTLTASCISVSLGNHPTKHAVGVSYKSPSSPFAAESRDDVDAAWKNPKNGNLISFLSDCMDDTDPTLDSIVQGSLSGLSDLHFQSTQNPTMQGREARRVLASGKVDGVPTKIDLIAFKRNRCIYILSYVGVEQNFDQDHGQFDRFLAGFVAP